MKVFKYELIITDQDVEGDEFWEQALERDGTGIAELTEAIAQAIEDSNLMVGSDKKPIEALKLKSYSESE
jgi:hypothetical protein